MKILNYFLVLFFPVFLNSQIIMNQTSKFKAGLEIGHFAPEKRSFAENYEQAVDGFPLSVIGISGHYLYTSKINFTFAIRFIYNYLSSTQRVKFMILPIDIGLKYYFAERNFQIANLKFFIEGKIGYYLNIFAVRKFFFVDKYGNGFGYQDTLQIFTGPGMNTALGIEFPINHWFDAGIKVIYDYNKIGEIEKGGLGNTGGFTFSFFSSITL